MRTSGVALVCGRLEPGHDGVGDYTRTLAEACAQAGVRVALIGLNDSNVKGSAVRENCGFPVLRLPARANWADNVPGAGAFVNEMGLSWASFQFVPYSYGKRGLVSGLAEKLEPLTRGRNLQVMFHEIWIGATEHASLKDRLVGWLQRGTIREFARRASPKVVHTSNSAYMKLLRSIGVDAVRLPLPGTIPLQRTDASAWLYGRLSGLGVDITETTRPEFAIFGFFGTLHPVWPAEPLVSQLEEFAQRTGRKPIMLSFGKLGSGEALWNRLSREKRSGGMRWCSLGLVSALEASQLMNSVDFGVAASPLSLLEKSSAAVCLLEHGLPVIVNRNDACFSGIDSEAGISSQIMPNWRTGFVERLQSARRQPVLLRVPAVRDQFLRDLGLEASRTAGLPHS